MSDDIRNSLHTVIYGSKANLLLPFGPLAVFLHYTTEKHGVVFVLSLLGIIPLAERLGFITEQISFYTGPTVGGLLNATFGNATEMIVSLFALKNGMIRVVQQNLLGSILSNLLSVLGSAFFIGGIANYKKTQPFCKANAVMNSGLMLMSVMGLISPTVLHYSKTEANPGVSELSLSRFISCIMLFAYALSLFFQLKKRKPVNSYTPLEQFRSETDQPIRTEELPEITHREAILWLFIITLCVSFISEYLVDAIQGASEDLNVPVAFVSVILLPIGGNAAAYATCVMCAVKNKLDITLGVAIGSSTQISMFVLPFYVVVGWFVGQPMDLNFQLFETAVLFSTVLVVAFILQEGTSNYFKGLMLMLAYFVVAASFFVHVDLKPGA